jgi:RNA polymerase sigma factor (sigma-70 family)
MARAAIGPVARQIEALFASGSVAGMSDRQLLDRFASRNDAAAEPAFAAIVSRHGPMVLEVCVQLLRDQQLAEDAFQAVFLVLARRGHALRDPDRLANWLYGVAVRTSRKAKSRMVRRRRHEGDQTIELSAISEKGEPTLTVFTTAEQLALDREQAEVLHDEIDRLPQSFRLPIVLCYFEGLTLDEAGR